MVGSIKYETEKTIKYIHIRICPLNRVNDPIGNAESFSLIGPFDGVGYIQNFRQEIFWLDVYVHNIAKCFIEVIAEFMDGTAEAFDGNNIGFELPMPPAAKATKISKTAAFLLHFFSGIFGGRRFLLRADRQRCCKASDTWRIIHLGIH